MCEKCTKLAKCDGLIINDSSLCSLYCEPYFTSNRICNKCKEIDHFDVHPALRSCTKCLSMKQQCIKRAFFVITTNCEEGNKKMFLAIREKIEPKTIGPNLSLLSRLPDPPHLIVLKLLSAIGC